MKKISSLHISKTPQHHDSTNPAHPAKKSNEIRIIAGSLKQKKIHVLERPSLRPTPERLREALFNSLGQNLHQIKVLDLFSGSGALAFEAYSRGATVCVIEKDAKNFQIIQKTAQIWRLDNRWYAYKKDAFDVLKQKNLLDFNIILLDPPYHLAALPHIFCMIFKNIFDQISNKDFKLPKPASKNFKILIYCEHNQALDFEVIFNLISDLILNTKRHYECGYTIKKQWNMGQVHAYLSEWEIK